MTTFERSRTLNATPPFAFDLALDYLRLSPSAVIERVVGDSYLRPVCLNGRGFILRVSSHDPVASSTLSVELLGDAPSVDDLEAAGGLAVRIFATDHDITGMSDVAKADPVFGRLVKRYRGLRPV